MPMLHSIFCWLLKPDNLTAISTLTIAAFTIVLAIGSSVQAWLTREAIRVAREEFISSHRPRIVLRDVDMASAAEGHEIYYMLANSGDTRGTIIESWVIAESVPPDKLARNLRSFGHDDLGRLVFAAGEMKDLTYRCPTDVAWLLATYSAAGKQHIDTTKLWNLYFAGAILYSDDAGNLRRSVFRRRWDFERECFCRVDNPDQEYAD